MPMQRDYLATEPTRAEVDALSGATVIEFGAPWCPHCIGAQSLLASAFENHADLPHLKIEDAAGRRLGRSFRIKLWPTLVFFRNGVEISRLVRPTDADEIERAMAALGASS